MRERSLFSRICQGSHYRIRPARNDDWPAIERLLSYADRCYMGLQWWTVQEWLGSPTLLLATDQRERLVGLMLAVIGDGPVAWLRAIAALSDGCLTPLLEASAQAVLAQDGTGLAFLDGEGWILPKLKGGGFQQVNRVITLRRRGAWPAQGAASFDQAHDAPFDQAHDAPDLRVRTATPADIDAVLAVDHAAFPPLWWYDRKILHRALNLTLCFHVAYLDGDCVGYQFSTLRHGRGHIVRLAIHPRWQRRGIGGQLLTEALAALDLAGAESFTVNTQEDNLASLQLYQRFTFGRVGKPWTVWFRSLVQQ